MTRGIGGHSPANVSHHLEGIDFPASKQDLIRQARDNGAGDDVLEVIEAMPQGQYASMADVMVGYGDADNEGGRERDDGGRFREEREGGRFRRTP